jgi:hypothetical protein
MACDLKSLITNRLKPSDNEPTIERLASEPRGDGVSASIRWRGARVDSKVRTHKLSLSVVMPREQKMLNSSSCSGHGGCHLLRHGRSTLPA